MLALLSLRLCPSLPLSVSVSHSLSLSLSVSLSVSLCLSVSVSRPVLFLLLVEEGRIAGLEC